MSKDYNDTKVKIKANPITGPLQALAAVLAFFAIILAFIVAGGYLSRVITGTTDRMTLKITETTNFTLTPSPTPKPTPTPTPVVIRELLDSKMEYTRTLVVDEYFGPLPEVDQIIPPKHFDVKGIYIGSADNIEANIELAKNSEINAFVLDLKESYGVLFNSQNEIAREIGYVTYEYELQEIVDLCHENDIYLIGRIVCFKDSALATKYPDRAICDADGNPLQFKTEGNKYFASPYNQENWDYLIDLAEEALSYGIDEIQFDYVRFPTGSTVSGAEPYYGIEGMSDSLIPTKAEAVNRFLQTCRRVIQDPTGIPVSGDIFGIAVSSNLDGQILGQDWTTVGFTGIDSVCPMIYPSHYALGTIMNKHEMPYPDKEPYECMYNALMVGSLYHDQEGYAEVRPYCQAFTAYYIGEGKYGIYDYDGINAQIRGLQDAGLSEFVLWNVLGEYPEGLYGGNRG